MQQFPTVTTSHRREATEVYRLERRATKNIATENDLYNSISIIHNGHYHKQITREFKTAPSPYILTQKAVTLNACRTVRKCLAE